VRVLEERHIAHGLWRQNQMIEQETKVLSCKKADFRQLIEQDTRVPP